MCTREREREMEKDNCEILNVPGCLPGRGSQTEKGVHLWDCALERCSPDTLTVCLSSAPGRTRTIHVN